ILLRNVIRALHDMYYVRAGVAYVDSGSTFVFADITSADMPLSALSLAKNVSRAYRVEGITAIHFEEDDDGRGVTVWLIAEGDNSITGRDIENAESQKFRGNPRWSALTGLWDSEKYYEEFSMRWRTRNVETP
ncbi:MAG: hypothetical protein LBT23_08630, partial [Synergistaceae bacterium]|nr:hypothetical protein [Synergistaceae bacterium]